MSQPDRTVPRDRWPAFFRFVTQDACGTPIVVQQPADPGADTTAAPRLLDSIGYRDDVDEVVVVASRVTSGAATGGATGPRTTRIRMPRPQTVLADDTQACPRSILILSAQVPPTIILFDRATATQSGTP